MKKITTNKTLKEKKGNNLSKKDKKPLEVKKSYIIANGLEYKGKIYRKGEKIRLSNEEIKNFPTNSIK